MPKKSLPKIIVILGPTASGKSDFATMLARKFNGEIVSADSRQVYKGMDIGTGKVLRDKLKVQSSKLKTNSKENYLYKGIRHHLLDVVSPNQKFDVAKYQKLAGNAIEDILRRGKLPIVCGGTGFYIQAIVDNVVFPEVKANEALRKKLEKQLLEKLLKTLKKLDIARWKTVDKKNKRRVIRAIEIATAIGKVPKLKSNPKYDALQIGLSPDKETLKKNIEKRLRKRLEQGMVSEVKKLRASGVSWKKLVGFGLEYKFVALYLQEKLTKEEMIEQLNAAIWQYAKRQMTWFARDKRIVWLENKTTKWQSNKATRQ